MILVFDRAALVVECNPNDDSVEFCIVTNAKVDRIGGIDASHLDHWKPLIGKSFGWSWITVNQQEYCDGLLFSFDGIHPQLMLTIAASSVVVSTVTRV